MTKSNHDQMLALVERYDWGQYNMIGPTEQGHWVKADALTAALDEIKRLEVQAECREQSMADQEGEIAQLSEAAKWLLEENKRLRSAMQELYVDLIDNADHELLVNVNESVWTQFCAALKGSGQ